MSRVEDAAACFARGFNCSQAVLWAYAPSFGLDPDEALKVAAGFGGGMALMGQTCGAVTGAYMVLGLGYGATAPQDRSARFKTYDAVKEFSRRFQARCGSTVCKDLLGFDIGTPEGLKLAAERDVHQAVCPRFVRAAAEILGEML
jgi:C_GCAxxG_C_C family probable redox protein